MNIQSIIIINPLASADYLYNSMKENNINPIAVFVDIESLDAKLHYSECFHIKIFTTTVNVFAAIKDLFQKHDIIYIINGFDQSIELTESIISTFLPQYANGEKSAHILSSKFMQQETLKQNKLPFIQQELITTKDINLELLNNLQFPLFAKPLDGGATIGAFLSNTPEELIEQLASSPKKIGFRDINKYLLQEYISSTEVVVDVFSFNGEHLISNVYVYDKDLINNTNVYRQINIVRDKTIIKNASAFSKMVLDSAAVKYGFSHIELFMISKDSFKLIEINPRISGGAGVLNQLTKYTNGNPQEKILVNMLRKSSLESLDIDDQPFGRILCIYSNKTIDAKQFKTCKQIIIMNDKPLQIDYNQKITFADVRQLVLLTSDNYELLELETKLILAEDVV